MFPIQDVSLLHRNWGIFRKKQKLLHNTCSAPSVAVDNLALDKMSGGHDLNFY